MLHHPRRVVVGSLLATALVAGLSVVGVDASSAAAGRPVVSVLSTDADKVTGGDALVEVRVPDSRRPSTCVSVDGRDVTGSFHPTDARTFRGLVTGLVDGDNVLVARANGNGRSQPPGRSASLVLVNHPISGPVFSGEQQQPFYCETVAAGLGPAADATCAAPTQIVYRYRTTSGGFAVLADPADRPANLASVTVDGVEVPYIVRLERGVINRGVYELAALHDGEDPSPLRAETGWNERLVMTFGGGCNVGYRQGTGTAGVLLHDALSRGFAVASNSLLVNETNCNPLTAAETALMTKERFIEVYGPVEHTIGWGGSGGAIMQHTITHGYPGILDGLLPQLSYAGAASNAGPADCAPAALPRHPDGATFTAAQRQAVGGHRNFNACLAWVLSFANRISATTGCPAVVPPATIYDPVTNPTGVRCSLADLWVKQLGVDPDTGFARSTFDNTGIQYGLGALEDGVISVEQFLALNEQIGGYDGDGLVQSERSAASPEAIERAFATGLVTSGSGGLASTPTIDVRVYLDNNVDIHTSFWSVAMHERLVRDGVDPRLHSRWIHSAGDGTRGAQALDAMDAWLTAIATDTAPGTDAERAARNRPAAADPGCWASAGADKIEDLGACYELFPYSGDPRTVAGAPITSDITCQRAAPDRDAYSVTFTDAEWDRLLAAFPDGVCDWSRPGVGQVPIAGTWQEF